MQAFCDNKITFYCQYPAANVFLPVSKAVSEPTVLQHVPRYKEHVFQALTLELTWDLNKNCIIVIRDKISISMRKSYNDMYTNKTAIQRNKIQEYPSLYN